MPLADSTLVPAPADLSDEEALLLGDILSTACFAADQASWEPACGQCSAAAMTGQPPANLPPAALGAVPQAGIAALAAAAAGGSGGGGGGDDGSGGPVVAVVGCGPVGLLAILGECGAAPAREMAPSQHRLLPRLADLDRRRGNPPARRPQRAPPRPPSPPPPRPAAALELGAARVLAIDSVPERLALAERYGATPVDRERQDPVEAVR